jgi:hypothetical protein
MIGINLIDESVLVARRRVRRLQKWAMVIAAALVVASFPVGVEISRQHRLVGLRDEQNDANNKIQSAKAKLEKTRLEVAQLNVQIDRADALRTKRSWSRLLHLIERNLPDEMWMVAIATDPPVPPSGVHDRTRLANSRSEGNNEGIAQVVTFEAPRAIVLEGYTLHHGSLYDFMARLKQTKVFNDVELTKASEEPVFASKAVRFKLTCRW